MGRKAWVGTAGFVAFLLILFGGSAYANHQETEQMTACVTAGGEWVLNSGWTMKYECQRR